MGGRGAAPAAGRRRRVQRSTGCDGARGARRDGDRGTRRQPGQPHRVRRAHARDRSQADSLLAPRLRPGAGGCADDAAHTHGHVQGQHARPPGARRVVPLPRGPPRLRRPARAVGPRAGIQGLVEEAGRELRRRGHRRAPRRPASGRPRRRREPAARRDRAPVQRESVHAPASARPGLSSAPRSPLPGDYDIVFDTLSASSAGPFTFRFWIGDTTPPRLKLLSARGGIVRVSARDAGAGHRSGPDPALRRRASAVDALRRATRADRRPRAASSRAVATGSRLVVSDYQELKNMENVRRILPNTAQLRTAFFVR